tara:strand:- start:8037 stop:9029 length:993 start_codon:yes stop_codon:yes gene_type:complete
MTRKTLHLLAAVVVVLALLLLAIGRSEKTSGTHNTALLPEFKSTANAVDRIHVVQPGSEEAVTITRRGSDWVVVERADYRADVGKLRKVINALADARIVEEKTANPDHYAKLGVDDPAESGSGTRIDLSGPDFAYSLIIGNLAQGSYRYVRISDQARSYLIDTDPSIPASAVAWLDAELIDLAASDVRSVTITHRNGETIVIEKTEQEQTDFVVRDIPEGRELSYATVGNGIAGALQGLQLTDVRKEVAAPAEVTAEFSTWDGTHVAVDVIDNEEGTWLSFSATLSDEEASTSELFSHINERLAGWQYQVPEYKKNLLTRDWDELLKDTE